MVVEVQHELAVLQTAWLFGVAVAARRKAASTRADSSGNDSGFVM